MGWTLVSAGKLSQSWARLLAGRVTTLWLCRLLSVTQHGHLSLPSLRGRLMSSNPCYSGLRRQTAERRGERCGLPPMATSPPSRYRLECRLAAGSRPRKRDEHHSLALWAVREPTSHWGLCLCLYLMLTHRCWNQWDNSHTKRLWTPTLADLFIYLLHGLYHTLSQNEPLALSLSTSSATTLCRSFHLYIRIQSDVLSQFILQLPCKLPYECHNYSCCRAFLMAAVGLFFDNVLLFILLTDGVFRVGFDKWVRCEVCSESHV